MKLTKTELGSSHDDGVARSRTVVMRLEDANDMGSASFDRGLQSPWWAVEGLSSCRPGDIHATEKDIYLGTLHAKHCNSVRRLAVARDQWRQEYGHQTKQEMTEMLGQAWDLNRTCGGRTRLYGEADAVACRRAANVARGGGRATSKKMTN